MNAADLDVKSICDGLELFLTSSELRQSDVDRGTKGSTEVRGAGGDIAEVVIVGKTGDTFNVGACLREASEDSTDVSTWLH